MKFYPILFICFIFFANCKEETEQNYDRYFLMDKSQPTETLFNPSKKATIPFTYNQIYDPFLTPESIRKSVYEPGKTGSLILHVIDSITSSINVGGRKRKEKIVKGFPVIIENTSEIDTMHLPLHRGAVILIQEVKNDENIWKPVEHESKEKLGQFYYKISPKEYIYTKIPIYKGKSKVPFRVKIQLNDSTVIYSKEYGSTINNRWLR